MLSTLLVNFQGNQTNSVSSIWFDDCKSRENSEILEIQMPGPELPKMYGDLSFFKWLV